MLPQLSYALAEFFLLQIPSDHKFPEDPREPAEQRKLSLCDQLDAPSEQTELPEHCPASSSQ